eukprot:jgi/Mesvir1/5055/Mv02256-RA.1
MEDALKPCEYGEAPPAPKELREWIWQTTAASFVGMFYGGARESGRITREEASRKEAELLQRQVSPTVQGLPPSETLHARPTPVPSAVASMGHARATPLQARSTTGAPLPTTGVSPSGRTYYDYVAEDGSIQRKWIHPLHEARDEFYRKASRVSRGAARGAFAFGGFTGLFLGTRAYIGAARGQEDAWGFIGAGSAAFGLFSVMIPAPPLIRVVNLAKGAVVGGLLCAPLEPCNASRLASLVNVLVFYLARFLVVHELVFTVHTKRAACIISRMGRVGPSILKQTPGLALPAVYAKDFVAVGVMCCGSCGSTWHFATCGAAFTTNDKRCGSRYKSHFSSRQLAGKKRT